MNGSFILYTEYAEHMELLSMEQRGVLITAVFAYEMGEPLPDMDLGVKMAFSFIKANLDRNRNKYEEIKQKRSAAGLASAQARANKREQTLTHSTSVKHEEQTATNPTVNVNDNVNVNVNDNKKEKEKEREKRTRFIPPSVDEVRTYCKERNNTVDPQTFVDFYSSKGWKVGNNPMKDWRACVRTWEKREDRTHEKTVLKKNPFTRFDQRTYSDDDLERKLLAGVAR